MTRIAVKTTVERRWGAIAPTVRPLREALGRAHYERMRSGMSPHLNLARWEELSPASREAYARRLDYVVPDVLSVFAELTKGHPLSQEYTS